MELFPYFDDAAAPGAGLAFAVVVAEAFRLGRELDAELAGVVLPAALADERRGAVDGVQLDHR